MGTSESFFTWAFARHHNVLSWYIRPLFILPFCYFAYRRHSAGIAATILLLLTSMFWFPAPQTTSLAVADFLTMEQQYLMGDWSLLKIAVTLLVPLTMSALAYAFWQHSFKAGVIIVILIAFLKIFWSVIEGGSAGLSILVPALLGLGICIAAILFFVYRQKNS
jgi:predicted ferric reductase